jgi:hypothetical protein
MKNFIYPHEELIKSDVKMFETVNGPYSLENFGKFLTLTKELYLMHCKTQIVEFNYKDLNTFFEIYYKELKK